MPIYTYRCAECGVQFERRQSFSDQPLTRCPECNKKSLHKVYTPVGIVFKGSGFYATDHKSPSGQKTRSAKGDANASGGSNESSSESSSPASSETNKTNSTDSKPAAS